MLCSDNHWSSRASCCSLNWLTCFACAPQPLVKSGELFTQLAGFLREGSLAGCSYSAGENDIESDRGSGILGVRAMCSTNFV